MQELLMEAEQAYKIYFDGRTDDPHCFKWTIYVGKLLADCKVGDMVVVTHGGNQYPARIWGLEQFNKPLHEGKAGLGVGICFSNHHPELPAASHGDNLYPRANGISIYKA